MYLQSRSDSSAFSLQHKGHYVVSYEHTKKPYQARIRHMLWVKTRIRCIQQRAIDHDCSLVFMSSLWPSVAWFAAMWGYIWTTVLNSNKYSLLTCWLNMCCKRCLKKPDYYSVQIDKDKKCYELWNSIEVWRNMAKPPKYVEVCLSQDASGFFLTLHKFHLHKVCCPYSSQSLVKIDLFSGIKTLCNTLGHGQAREKRSHLKLQSTYWNLSPLLLFKGLWCTDDNVGTETSDQFLYFQWLLQSVSQSWPSKRKIKIIN